MRKLLQAINVLSAGQHGGSEKLSYLGKVFKNFLFSVCELIYLSKVIEIGFWGMVEIYCDHLVLENGFQMGSVLNFIGRYGKTRT